MMIFYLSLDPFSLASQTDRTGPNAEINVDFFVAEKKVLVEMNAACQINILTLQYYWRVAGICLSCLHNWYLRSHIIENRRADSKHLLHMVRWPTVLLNVDSVS